MLLKTEDCLLQKVSKRIMNNIFKDPNSEQSAEKEIRLDLDFAVLHERDGRLSSILDKFGISIFEEEAREKIHGFEREEKERLQYYASQAFLSGGEDGDSEMQRIKEQVFLTKKFLWEPLRQEEEISRNPWNTFGILISLLPLLWLYLIYRESKKRKQDAGTDHRYGA